MKLLHKCLCLYAFYLSANSYPAIAQCTRQAAPVASFSNNIQNKRLSPQFTQDWYSQAVQSVQQAENSFYPQPTPSHYRVANAANHIYFHIQPGGYTVRNIRRQPNEVEWNADFKLLGAGRSVTAWTPANTFTVMNSAETLTYKYNALSVQYINNNSGLRQNFIVQQKPTGNGAVAVHLLIGGNLQPTLQNSSRLVLSETGHAANARLVYEDLHVWDANQQPLAAAMKLNGHVLSIEVDDRNATYPITIDPINKSAEWNTSAEGVVGSLVADLQLKASLYGFAVSNVGDVNGDGFGDAAISAPALVDVFSGTGSLSAVGAVFVFYGSPAGLSVTPNKTLQPNTAVAGALFGASVDGGDVTGDGINDIIIGAPLDRVTLSAGLGSISGTIGKVYVYPGGVLAGTNPTNFLTVQLNTANVSSLNISNNALFGFSVAVTEDLNADNKKDIIVGAPGYAGTGLLDVRSGGAFVFLSGTGNTFPVIQSLDAPTFSLLGINLPLLNGINGLLFGYSVDGVGDYNNDGKADVVVGAPAGVDLSGLTGILSGQVLGGQALVYYGKSNNTGVNTAVGARLQAASSGLLGNAANLFGFKVKGVRSVAGIRNGNILAGAPTGSLVPNALGLNIKTGSLHVFKRKASAPASPVTADQQLESPRSTSVLQVLNTLDLNVLFATSFDNAYDVNCDGYADLVVGEPLSSGATLLQVQANPVGGAAYVFVGDGNGGYLPPSRYDVSSTYGSDFLSVNATALFGYSVAGVPHVTNASTSARILVGAPSGTLDFDNSVLNLGSTLGLLYNFAAVDNGVGKGYLFNPSLCSGGTLPVTLLNFKGAVKNAAIDLKWQTNNEYKVSHYEVQKSTNGLQFETLGLVFSFDNSAANNYYFTDNNPGEGTNYYRLNMVDKDGAHTYSTIISFHSAQLVKGTVSIAPNPVKAQIRMVFNGLEQGRYRVAIRTATGQSLQSSPVVITRSLQVEYIQRTGIMQQGLYWITVYDKNNKVVSANSAFMQ